MMQTDGVWETMVDAFERGSGSLATRLMAALHAAEETGGDFRGQRSAAIKVVRATRSGRPWRDSVVDLRVDDHETPVDRLGALVERSARYNRMVGAFERALDGQTSQALEAVIDMPVADTKSDADMQMWRAAILTFAGREEAAASALAALNEYAPEFVDVLRELETTGLVDEPAAWKRVLPNA
jgi:uncharacterized Ntn-hydrolase superfamily protein